MHKTSHSMCIHVGIDTSFLKTRRTHSPCWLTPVRTLYSTGIFVFCYKMFRKVWPATPVHYIHIFCADSISSYDYLSSLKRSLFSAILSSLGEVSNLPLRVSGKYSFAQMKGRADRKRYIRGRVPFFFHVNDLCIWVYVHSDLLIKVYNQDSSATALGEQSTRGP